MKPNRSLCRGESFLSMSVPDKSGTYEFWVQNPKLKSDSNPTMWMTTPKIQKTASGVIRWPRMIALIDMNAFFASLEQLDNPFWRGRPVAVTNGERGTCCITSSYEAREFGVKTAMHLKKARQLCPGLIQAPARPDRYAEVSTKIMKALEDICPEIEIFSVDEAFLDLTDCQSYYRHDPQRIGQLIKQKVFEASGLLCSVGISGDKTTAKWAAKRMKPNGLTIIEPWRSAEVLSTVPVTDLCGIKKGIGGYLAQRGVHVCGDMHRLPISELSRRFGNIGRRIWHMAQGQDPDELHMEVKDPKTIGHGKVIPPNTRDLATISIYLMHMAMKVGRRLRKHEFQAQQFSIGLLSSEDWIGAKYKTTFPCDDGFLIYELCRDFLKRHWSGQGVYQVHIRALDPKPKSMQSDLFFERDEKRERLNAAIDQINKKYGEFTVCPAPLINRSDMPNVIAPSWRPFGHRETIGA